MGSSPETPEGHMVQKIPELSTQTHKGGGGNYNRSVGCSGTDIDSWTGEDGGHLANPYPAHSPRTLDTRGSAGGLSVWGGQDPLQDPRDPHRPDRLDRQRMASNVPYVGT
ncbi:unnamed protein product [Gadus morhua 'NCC']